MNLKRAFVAFGSALAVFSFSLFPPPRVGGAGSASLLEVQGELQVSFAENVIFAPLSRARRISSPFSVNVDRPDSMTKRRRMLWW